MNTIILSSRFFFCPPSDRIVSSEVIFNWGCIRQQYCACAFAFFQNHWGVSRFRIVSACRRPNTRGLARRTPLTRTLSLTTEYLPNTDRRDRGPATVRNTPPVLRWPDTIHRSRRAVKCRRADARCHRGQPTGH